VTTYSKVAALGCIVCRVHYNVVTPAQIHHLRVDTGMGQKSDKVIPLCPLHHQHGGYGVAYHAGPKEWERRYGTQLELWQKVQELL